MTPVHPLTAFRAERSLSMVQLAAMLGVTKATVSRWEGWKRIPDRRLWPVIREKTGVSHDELLGLPISEAAE